ncbi:forkhead-associated domain-containing protein 1-like [Babylonia areolata]|uniref:forkhead-associated domain-containing protein 1-like n=1 Tax=Babylonia areolata TaxID=304850 RepID=UPI003FD492CF
MKAVLKGQDGSVFPLSPKVTTIGREGCDINIQVQGIDYQHAVVENCEQEECLILQDLNSAQGTYVNDVRVQNAAVRLAPGDRIRFGYNGMPYELTTEPQSVGVLCPPVQPQQRPAWHGSLTILNESPTYGNAHTQHALQQQQQQQQQLQQQMYHQALLASSQGLPFIPPPGPLGQQGSWSQAPQPPLPRPPLRSRPLSAGSARRSTFDLPRGQPASSTVVGAPVTRQGPVGGWVNGQRGTAVASPTTTLPSAALDLAQQQAQEKDLRLGQLSEEVSRLRSVEFESLRKDQLIQQLQQQIDDQQKKLQQEPSIIMGSADPDGGQRLAQMEAEVTMRRAEVASLKEQLSQVRAQGAGSPSMLRQELGERVKEITALRSELDRVRRDRTSSNGLVTSMRRDTSCKESTINKLTREIEALKKDVRERDKLLADANVTKIREASSTTKLGEERDAREKELISLRQRFKGAESKISEQFNAISSLKEEAETLQRHLQAEKEASSQARAAAEETEAKLQDSQKAEEAARAETENAVKALQEFRNRMLETLTAAAAVEEGGEPSDEQLAETLHTLLQDRLTLSDKVKAISKDATEAAATLDRWKAEGEKLRAALQECTDGVKEKGRLSSPLSEAVSAVQSLSVNGDDDDDNSSGDNTHSKSAALAWVRDLVADILISELQWQTGIEDALEKCGVQCGDSSEAPGHHIELLLAKWESSLSEKEHLTSQVAEMEQRHLEEVKVTADTLRQQLEGEMADAVENARLEGEERARRAVEEVQAAEAEKLQTAVSEEQQRVAELETTLEELRQVMSEQKEAERERLEESSVLVTQLENYKLLELELKEQLVQAEERLKTEVGTLEEEVGAERRGREEEVEGYKEQVRQHSVTICSMEERLAKLNKRNADHLAEVAALRTANSDLKVEVERLQSQKPAVPPKPKVIVQRPTEEISALEEVVAVLRAENLDLKKSLTEQQDVVMGLRRDLAGASARLSDITGEMSEAQKREMEQNRELLGRRDLETTELRQQMAKLSKIIDKQKAELTSLKEQLDKEKSVVMKYRTEMDDRDSRLSELQCRLKDEKEEQKRQLDLLDQEGRITSELVGIGAQCRGERHDQIITRQREALAELRSRVKVLEQSKAPLPTPDQALQQVVMLKRELAEIRAQQALSEDRVLATVTGAAAAAAMERQVAPSLLPGAASTEAEMERSAHRETMDSLERSEQTFLSLLRAMSAVLEVEEVGGLRTMTHLPRDEREGLVLEREDAVHLLANRIQVLKERVARKDQLLQGYENDLAKLRQSQQVAERKAAQVDNLAKDVQSRAEESQYLRETLNRTRDKLNQEKRLNHAIKEKKTFHLENERAHLRPQSAGGSRSQTQEDKIAAAARRKVQKETMKRKNYEIRTLKEELCDKEQALFDREKRLSSLETSLGLERPVEVLE